MIIHVLKTHPGPFQDVWLGIKRFEVRKDDRNYNVGDLLVLKEYHMHTGYTGRSISYLVVVYKLSGGQFGIAPGFCVLGLDIASMQTEDDPKYSGSSDLYKGKSAYEKAQMEAS